MGVDGHFFDLAVSARTELRLRDLPKIGNLAVAGVDASIWVHQLARTVDPLAWLNGQYQAVIDRFVLRLYKLRSRYSVAPYVVFDGAPNPAKRDTEDKREKQRAKAAAQLDVFKQRMAAGLAVVDAHLQSVLDELGFGYERAPSEADSQLTDPSRTGRIEYTITEDSDFVVLGCPRVIRGIVVAPVARVEIRQRSKSNNKDETRKRTTQ